MKFIPCDEDSQIYSFSRTNKKSKQLDLNVTSFDEHYEKKKKYSKKYKKR
jgi:hypothetical protein